uniref:Uncharacterized protein n=1 Tax=Siphoviridae sp. ctvuW5 TaxID=2825725 RepID=A0A8S5TXA1_9CAUD|nr:MAG TPA: hypothetical protein [Siphoviridae sp. ctvuW5]
MLYHCPKNWANSLTVCKVGESRFRLRLKTAYSMVN